MMYQIKEVILVEGRYDKNTLSQFLKATIMETEGFGIFSNSEKIRLLSRLAHHPGLIVLTDSDSAGFLIRNHLKGKLQGGRVLQAYIPDRFGKERRKKQGGKEGKLGVEAMDKETIVQALRTAGATFLCQGEIGEEMSCETQSLSIKTVDLYELGLTGGVDSKAKREQVLKALDLPMHIRTNALLDILNALYDFETGIALLKKIVQEKEDL